MNGPARQIHMVPTLYDCFLFFNELDLLELRLNELAEVVDHFVLAESEFTFTGLRKPLYFAENKRRFSDFLSRITHLVVPHDPSASAWEAQYHQRRSLACGLLEARDDDLVLVSDVDEIPRALTLAQVKATPPAPGEILCFELRMYYYFVNLEAPEVWRRSGPRCGLRSTCRDLQSVRNIRGRDPGQVRDLLRAIRACAELRGLVRRTAVRDAGWHFSYLGGATAIGEKVAAVSSRKNLATALGDAELAADWIARRRAPRVDETGLLVARNIDASFPSFLIGNSRFQHLTLQPSHIAAP
jgi:beta-1,4-mannosyl-glycoprotein beta-1,4-N-acetylglucosaminyltransferase